MPKYPDQGMRLNKYIAHCGICSRRKAETFIAKGWVRINDQPADHPSIKVQEGDTVTLQGKVIRPEERKVYLLMNKPKNTITTANDPRGRRTVVDLVRNKVQERVYPVGRLDRDTTGLLLLTNDGGLAKKLAHPSYEIKKTYQVTVNCPIEEAHIELIRKGITLEDGFIRADEVMRLQPDIASITLHSGRNRIVRRIFEHFGYQIIRLDRVYFAGLTKKGLSRGHVRHLTKQEVIMLKHFT